MNPYWKNNIIIACFPKASISFSVKKHPQDKCPYGCLKSDYGAITGFHTNLSVGKYEAAVIGIDCA